MLINDKLALSEQVINDQYVMIFPKDAFLEAPFRVTTDDGDLVYEITDYIVFVRKEVKANGETKFVFGKLDPIGQKLIELEERIDEIAGNK